MFTFLHVADLELDVPIKGVLGEAMPESIASAVRDASLNAWDDVVATAIERRVAFVLVAGGVHEGAARGTRGQLRFRAGLARLDAAGIRTFIAAGRGDQPEDAWVVSGPLPELVHRFEPSPGGDGTAERVAFEANGDPVVVYGLGDSRHAPVAGLAGRFPKSATKGFSIGLMHAGVDTDETAVEDAGQVAIADLLERKIDYWALGASRVHQVWHADGPWVVAPGSTQARSPQALDRGPHGAVLVAVAGGRATGPELLPTDRIRFESVTVDVSELTTVAELLDRLQEAGDPAANDDRSLIMRATLVGSGPLHERLRDPANRGEVLDALRPRRVNEPFVWWDRVEWRLQPALDLDEVRKGHDFLADLLATARGNATGAAWKSGLPKLPADVARQLDTAPATSEPDIIARALGLALDELTEGYA